MAKITVVKNANGSLTLSCVHNGYLVQKTYYGYSESLAKDLFRQYLKGK